MTRSKRASKNVLKGDNQCDIDTFDIVEEEDGRYDTPKKRKAPRDVEMSSRKREALIGVSASDTVSGRRVANKGGLAADTIVVDTSRLVHVRRFAGAVVQPGGEQLKPANGFRGDVPGDKPAKLARNSFRVADLEPVKLACTGSFEGVPHDEPKLARTGSFRSPGFEQAKLASTGSFEDVSSIRSPDVTAASPADLSDSLIDALVESFDEELGDEPAELWDEGADELPAGSADQANDREKDPWNPKEWLDAFLNCTDESPLGPAIREMLEWCIGHAEASEDVLKFLEEENPSRWRSHCKSMDKIWAKYAPEFARICECDEAMLSKPSGPLNATLCIQWHYPTFTSSHLGYGMTFDPTNPCLKIQETKIGQSRRVLTIDTFPARTSKPEKGKKLSDNFYYWTEYRDLAVQFQHEIARHSQLRIVLGKQNWLLVQEHLEMQSDVIISRIPLYFATGSRKETVSFYGRPAELLVVQAKATMIIEQIIIPSYHAEWLFYAYSGYDRPARMMDMTWNACAAIAGIDTVNPGYFQWKIMGHASMPRDRLAKAIYMVWKEKEGRPIDEEIVRDEFSDWLSRNSGRLDPTKGSLARQILCTMGTKGNETHAANGYPNLKKGRETNAVNGYPGLKKGRETQAANGYPSLKKGNETHAANGYPNLKKGLETNAVNGYPGLKKGRETQTANGYPNLKKGLETNAANGHPELKKGRETQAANGYRALKKGRETMSIAHEKRVNAKWQALQNGLVLVWERSEKKCDQNRAKKFHELNSQSWHDRARLMREWVMSKHFAWYSHENPNGLRYEGDEDKDIP